MHKKTNTVPHHPASRGNLNGHALIIQSLCAQHASALRYRCISICSNTALYDVVMLQPERTLDSRADPHAVEGSDTQNGTKLKHAVLTGHIPATHRSSSPCARAFVHAPVAANNKCYAVCELQSE